MDSKEDYLDSLLNSVMQEPDPEGQSNEEKDTDNGSDVTELLDSMPEDKELSEINDLLKQSDEGSKGSLADDMLALLEQADAKGRENDIDQSVPETQKGNQNEPFDFFAADDAALPENESAQKEPSGEVPEERDEWTQLLEPAQSKAEEKEQKKQEKQQAKEKQKEEKKRAKEEKARIKAEKAQEKANAKAEKKKASKNTNADMTEPDMDITMEPEAAAEGDAGQKTKEKKNGFFAKIFGGLLEEVPEKEETEIDISDENRAILEEVDQEEINPKKGKKKKDKKGKQGKKGAKAQDDEEADDDVKNDKKSQKAAKKKEKQARKAKKAEEKEFLKEPMTKLPKKKVISIFAISLTLLAIIVIVSLFVPAYMDRKEARKAYYNGDYESVYQLLSGEKLGKSDAILYERSVLVLYFDNKLEAYQLYKSLGEEKEALNELLTAVAFYQKNTERASECGAWDEIQPGYQKILTQLAEQYQISEAEASEIAQMEALDYNKALYRILYGTDFTIPEMVQDQEPGTSGQDAAIGEQPAGTQDNHDAVPTPVLSDVLPEEDQMILQQENGMTDNGTPTAPAQEPTPEATDDGQLLYSGTVENGQVILR